MIQIVYIMSYNKNLKLYSLKVYNYFLVRISVYNNKLKIYTYNIE